MEKIETIVTTVLAAIMIAFFAFLLGKKKEDIAIALNYQQYYNNIITALEKKIIELTSINKEQLDIIESQKKNIENWSNNCSKLEHIISEERKQNVELREMLKK